ncbi:MAG: phenylpyruvate tautomerase MIF-related protein [Cyanobacteriota bacterium PSP.bin.10]|jgi:phenylpyruvate tautomerase PptA (4-oxalocrotonate tautomerase family)|uniref:phenylpyruvate tautomerase MIF-related protein n=1 Tax=Synechococcus sp. R5-13 TaxID=2291953 RepID=UPI0028CF9108|nr:phenylpyruvate tautomerase MIF-related protein [Cyanobacteriota bacterium PSP.bin.10]
MPLIKLQTSVQPEIAAVEELLKVLSAALSEQLGKSEAYVMTAFEGGIPMTFAGSGDPCCYVEIKSIGQFSAQQTRAMSEFFCGTIEARLGIPKKRIYIEFSDAKGYLWGWNGTTFG